MLGRKPIPQSGGGFPATAACLIAFLLLALSILTATPAAAQRSLDCQKVWTGPSSSNDVLDCLKSKDGIRSQWKYYIYPGFAALIFVFTLIVLPIIYICRCCCCKTCCTSCTTTTNPARSRCWLWMWIIVALVLACCVCVLIIYGANLMMNTANDTVDSLRDGPLEYFNSTKEEILILLTDYSQTPPAPPNVDLSAFDDVQVEINGKLDTVQDDYFKYFKIARIVACCVGAVGVALMLMILLFACCRCGGCCPVAMSVLYWFFAIIFSLLAIVFTLGIFAAGAGCGEVVLQYRREPGLMQWYVVPWCETQFDFTTTRDEVNSEMSSACQSACGELLNYCDASDVYSVAEKDKVFVCGEGLTDASTCTTLNYLSEVILGSYAKPLLSNLLCTNTTGWEYLERCTVVECQTRCQDLDAPNIKAQTWSKDIVRAANFAMNASTALSYVLPMMDCNFIIDRIATAVEKETEDGGAGFTLSDSNADASNCSNLRASMVMVGTGFFVGSLMFLLAIYILLAGSWMWDAGK